MAACALGQQQAVMRMLVSTDGVNFSNSVDAAPGSRVDVLVTVSYLGNLPAVAGFGSVNFQPTVSNWNNSGTPDHLEPMRTDGNQLGTMINAQTNAVGAGSPNPYLLATPGDNGGAMVPAAPYVQGTYGRPYPMGRTYLGQPQFAFTGFVHVNPDGSGQTYLRIAQANIHDWFNTTTNANGVGGINSAQLYVVGRETNDPDFWGNRDLAYDPGDPANGLSPSFSPGAHDPALDARLRDVQVFRLGIDLSSDPTQRTMIVDAPLGGQERDPATGQRYVSFFTDISQPTGGLRLSFLTGAAGIETGAIHVVPGPGVVVVLGVVGLAGTRRRR
jgi:hypothetical protein